jgi:hypothetical protein
LAGKDFGWNLAARLIFTTSNIVANIIIAIWLIFFGLAVAFMLQSSRLSADAGSITVLCSEACRFYEMVVLPGAQDCVGGLA